MKVSFSHIKVKKRETSGHKNKKFATNFRFAVNLQQQQQQQILHTTARINFLIPLTSLRVVAATATSAAVPTLTLYFYILIIIYEMRFLN